MARPRSFDEAVVVDAAARCFTELGYAATSVDDLVSATGLHRGSLYGAFGSKRGLFLAALTRHTPAAHEAPEDDERHGVVGPAQQPSARAVLVPEHQLDEAVLGLSGGRSSARALDLLLVAALELAPHDDEVRNLVREACGALGPTAAAVLGRRLLDRARLDDDLPWADAAPAVPTGPTPTTPATRRA